MAAKLLLCDCAGSQQVDAERVSGAARLPCGRVGTGLCTSELGRVAEAMTEAAATDQALVIGCGQETARFEELAEELGAPVPTCVDLRNRAGWSDQAGQAGPKQAALMAEALLPDRPVKTLDVTSEGLCLIAGPARAALPLAEMLADALSVTVLLTDADEPPLDRRFEVTAGRLRNVSGAFGGFGVVIDGFRQVDPTGRGALSFGPANDGARSECDILIDVTGGTPLVPAPDKREGYLRADPGDPLAVARLAPVAAQMVGTFEKPLHVAVQPPLCAHSRAEQVGCTRCLDICPTGAISPAGEHVSVDPMICAGCGSCSAVCPSGAITWEDPPVDRLLHRLRTLAETYRAQGGEAPRLLVHDAGHGAELIALSARFGDGLPADCIPFALPSVAGFGHAEMLAALAMGFARVDLLLSPKGDREAPGREVALAAAMAGEDRVALHDLSDPDALRPALDAAPAVDLPGKRALPMGSRRQVARLAAQTLNPQAEAPLPLPQGAPYGAVLVDTDACTLCLSCVSLCPSGALMDNEDKPQLLFQEDACLQCGICANICPEDAIALKPQMELTEAALTQRVLNEEEPALCVECGAPFGVASTIERIVEQLAGKHPMFADGPAARMIRMCDDCRVKAQFHGTGNPFQGGERPRVRTTADYFSDRKDH